MKIAPTVPKALGSNKEHEAPPLTLIPDETELEVTDSTKSGSFKLYSNPADNTSPKYSFTMAYADGTQSIRFLLKWVENTQRVLRGMDITTGEAQCEMVKQLCKGRVLSSFNENILTMLSQTLTTNAHAAAQAVAQQAGETNAAFAARQATAYQAVVTAGVGNPTTANVKQALHLVIKACTPYKALEKQKRYMRRKMRKPADMKVRTYVTHLHRINFDELPMLPPQAATNSLSNDELIDIVIYGLPKSWVKEMDRQDFNPFHVQNINAIVDFCERLESAEDFNPDTKPKSTNKSSKKSRSGPQNSKNSGGNKWCDYHESNTHNTSECSVLKKLKESKSGSGDGKAKDKSKNKTWERKSNDAKKFTQKELNTMVKKATKKAVAATKKELNAIAKRKKDDDDDDDSVASIHMLETKMKDVDAELKKFNFDELEDGEEISV